MLPPCCQLNMAACSATSSPCLHPSALLPSSSTCLSSRNMRINPSCTGFQSLFDPASSSSDDPVASPDFPRSCFLSVRQTSRLRCVQESDDSESRAPTTEITTKENVCTVVEILLPLRADGALPNDANDKTAKPPTDQTQSGGQEALSKSTSSSNGSPCIDSNEDQDDGSVAARLFGSGWKYITNAPNASQERPRESPYLKSLRIKKMKLHHCTECLGSESLDVQALEGASTYHSSGSKPVNISEKQSEALGSGSVPVTRDCEFGDRLQCEDKNSRTSSRYNGKFPPPISYTPMARSPHLPSSSFSSLIRPHRKEGRLVLEEVRVPCREYLRASRKNGRLTLQLVRESDDENPAIESTSREELDIVEEAPESKPHQQTDTVQAIGEPACGMEARDNMDEFVDKKSKVHTTSETIDNPSWGKCTSARSNDHEVLFSCESKVLLGEAVLEDGVFSFTPSVNLSSGLNSSKDEELGRPVGLLGKAGFSCSASRTVHCVGSRSLDPVIERDKRTCTSLPPACSEPLLMGSLKPQTLMNPPGKNKLPCHDLNIFPTASPGKDFERKKLYMVEAGCGALSAAMKKMGSNLREGVKLVDWFRLDSGWKKRRCEEEEEAWSDGDFKLGARSLPAPFYCDFQMSSFAGNAHDMLHLLPCKKQLEATDLGKCLKLHYVATSS